MKPPRPFSALPAAILTVRLALKLFRGEPAISRFVWNFSANHKSSPTISTGPQSFTSASTCSWLGHQVSGLRQDTFRSLQTRFRFGSVPLTLNLASHRNSPAHSTKGTTSHAYGALSACKLTVSGSLSLPSRGSFHLSLTVLFAIGHMVVFSLLGWSPFLPSGFHVSRRTPDLVAVLTPPVFLQTVWAAPISLATTFGIVFTFFSSGY